jgi:hypothetical protein
MTTSYAVVVVRPGVGTNCPVQKIPPSWRNPPKKRLKRKAKRGAAAETVLAKGADNRQADFIRRLYLELGDRHIKAPGLTWMKQHMGPKHKACKARKIFFCQIGSGAWTSSDSQDLRKRELYEQERRDLF